MSLIGRNEAADPAEEVEGRGAVEDDWNLLDHVPGTARQRLLAALTVVLATVFLTTFTLYAVASWTDLLPRGPQGAQGPKGFDGKPGKRGKPGKDGKNGAPGRNGEDGEDGKDACELDPSELQYPELQYRFC